MFVLANLFTKMLQTEIAFYAGFVILPGVCAALVEGRRAEGAGFDLKR
jgi:hypothetical protein